MLQQKFIEEMEGRCRACNKITIETVSLFEVNGKIRKKPISQDYNFLMKGFLKERASEADMLPKTICINCFKILENCVKFVNKCIRSNVTMRKLREENRITEKPKRTRKSMISLDMKNEIKEDPFASSDIPNGPSEVDIELIELKPEIKAEIDEQKNIVEPLLLEPENENGVITNSSPSLQESFDQETFPENVDDSSENDEPKVEINLKPYCKVCGREFEHKRAYWNHVKNHKPKVHVTCDFCKKSFTTKDSLKQHIRIHTGERPYSCAVCDSTFTTIHALRSHKRIHTGEKPFVCNFCGKSFGQAGSLSEHLRIHTGRKPFKCDLCGKEFNKPNQLKSHHMIHTGEKPFSCSMCDKRFRTKPLLKLHIDTHIIDNHKYKCDQCGNTYMRKEKLVFHKRSHDRLEGKELPHRCKICGKNFIRRYVMHGHMLRIHKIDVKVQNGRAEQSTDY